MVFCGLVIVLLLVFTELTDAGSEAGGRQTPINLGAFTNWDGKVVDTLIS